MGASLFGNVLRPFGLLYNGQRSEDKSGSCIRRAAFWRVHMIPNETSPRYVAAQRLSAEVKVWLLRHQFSWTSAQEHRHCQVSAAAHPSQCVIRENRPSAASQCSQSEVPMRSRSNDETFQPHRVPTTRQRLQGIKPVFWCSLVMLTAGDRRPPQGKKNSHGIRNSGKKVTDDPPPAS